MLVLVNGGGRGEVGWDGMECVVTNGESVVVKVLRGGIELSETCWGVWLVVIVVVAEVEGIVGW